jgi:hypothetical protein
MGYRSNRRGFLLQLGAMGFAAIPVERLRALSRLAGAAPASGSATSQEGVIKNRTPLGANAFYPLPLGSVRPTGWLRRQLQIQANGLGGRLDETWPDVGPNSGWLGGTGEAWERGPYFLDGLVPLAYLLNDAGLKAKAQKYINWTLSNADSTGVIGPATNNDWWPRMVMLKVLAQYQEATGDAHVIPLMERYFAHQSHELPNRPLDAWGKCRWHVGTPVRPAAKSDSMQPAAASVVDEWSRIESVPIRAELRLLHRKHAPGMAQTHIKPLDVRWRGWPRCGCVRSQRSPRYGG